MGVGYERTARLEDKSNEATLVVLRCVSYQIRHDRSSEGKQHSSASGISANLRVIIIESSGCFVDGVSDFAFFCACCGERHSGLPDMGFRAPVFWNEADATANPADNFLNADLCVVGGADYFIRCVLEVPIQNTDAMLGWGVWVSQSKSNFELYADRFDACPERVTFGYLANRLPAYPDTVNMHTQVHWQQGRKRPIVELEAANHALYFDWADGIPSERAIEFVQKQLHPEA